MIKASNFGMAAQASTSTLSEIMSRPYIKWLGPEIVVCLPVPARIAPSRCVVVGPGEGGLGEEREREREKERERERERERIEKHRS